MEKDVALGSVGSLKFEFSGGKASMTGSVSYGPTGTQLNLSLVEDATALVDLLFAAIEKASPPGAIPIEESVKALVKAAVASIK